METRVLDGEDLGVEPEAFDAVISRVGLIYFPDQEKALGSMRRALKPGGRVAAIVYTTAENNRFFSLPSPSSGSARTCRHRCPPARTL